MILQTILSPHQHDGLETIGSQEFAWLIIGSVVNVVFSLVTSYIIIKRGKGDKMYNGLGIFLFGYGINQLFFRLSDYQYYTQIELQTTLGYQLSLIGYLFSILSSIYIIKFFETNIFWKKIVLSWVLLISGILLSIFVLFSVIFPDIMDIFDILRQAISVLAIAITVLILIFYIGMIRISAGELKRNFFGVFCGMAGLGIGSLTSGFDMKELFGYPYWIPAVFIAIGLFLIIKFQKPIEL